MKRNQQCKFTIAEEKEIITKYQNGKSFGKLGIEYHCDPTTISNILKAYEVPARTLSEARRNACDYSINEKVFEKIDTPASAYWLGVMYSDGYISKTNQYTNYFGLTVANCDIEWLYSFQRFLETTSKIKTYTQGQSGYSPGTLYSRLLIGNNKIVEDLEKWGVVEHKTFLTQSIPNIQYKDDFIRGVVDGDGSLRSDCASIRIYGNYNFLKDIGEYLGYNYRLTPDKAIFCLSFSEYGASRNLENRLYNGAEYYLQRKYNLAKRSFTSPSTLESVAENPE